MISGTGQKTREYFASQIGKGKRFETRAEMARFLGLGKTTQTQLFNFLDGKNTGFAAVSDWLDSLHIQVAFPGEELRDFKLVPRVNAVAGAGESFETDSSYAGMYAFSDDFMRTIGIKADSAEMMYVSGDSMQPLINNGDTVLIDKEDSKPIDGRIYVLSYGDALMVKRLQRTPRGWLICSENSSIYPPIPVEGQDLDQFKVYGRVRWVGRVL